MSKKVQVGLGVIVGLFVAMQLVPYGRDHDNPTERSEPAWSSPEVRELARRACFDCHSNETVWPWYASVAPTSWLVQDHVEDGRRHLNLSTNTWKGDAREEIREVIEEGEMPMKGYVLLHGEASLTPEEKKALIAGLEASLGKGGAKAAAGEDHDSDSDSDSDNKHDDGDSDSDSAKKPASDDSETKDDDADSDSEKKADGAAAAPKADEAPGAPEE